MIKVARWLVLEFNVILRASLKVVAFHVCLMQPVRRVSWVPDTRRQTTRDNNGRLELLGSEIGI